MYSDDNVKRGLQRREVFYLLGVVSCVDGKETSNRLVILVFINHQYVSSILFLFCCWPFPFPFLFLIQQLAVPKE